MRATTNGIRKRMQLLLVGALCALGMLVIGTTPLADATSKKDNGKASASKSKPGEPDGLSCDEGHAFRVTLGSGYSKSMQPGNATKLFIFKPKYVGTQASADPDAPVLPLIELGGKSRHPDVVLCFYLYRFGTFGEDGTFSYGPEHRVDIGRRSGRITVPEEGFLQHEIWGRWKR